MQLEQRLRTMLTRSSRSDHRRQIQHIQTYFSRLNQQSEHAEQRNLNLLNDLTQAQQRLDRLHHDAEHLARLKNDYSAYLAANYPRWQALRSSGASSQLDSSNEYDRLVQHIKRNPLESDGNLRQSGKFALTLVCSIGRFSCSSASIVRCGLVDAVQTVRGSTERRLGSVHVSVSGLGK